MTPLPMEKIRAIVLRRREPKCGWKKSPEEVRFTRKRYPASGDRACPHCGRVFRPIDADDNRRFCRPACRHAAERAVSLRGD